MLYLFGWSSLREETSVVLECVHVDLTCMCLYLGSTHEDGLEATHAYVLVLYMYKVPAHKHTLAYRNRLPTSVVIALYCNCVLWDVFALSAAAIMYRIALTHIFTHSCTDLISLFPHYLCFICTMCLKYCGLQVIPVHWVEEKIQNKLKETKHLINKIIFTFTSDHSAPNNLHPITALSEIVYVVVGGRK